MIAKIRDIDFNPDAIIVGLDCYFEEGEAGYEQWWVKVGDYAPTEEEPNPPTHLEFRPFRSFALSVPIDITRAKIRELILERLNAFKRAHNKVVQAQQFVGLEFKV